MSKYSKKYENKIRVNYPLPISNYVSTVKVSSKGDEAS